MSTTMRELEDASDESVGELYAQALTLCRMPARDGRDREAVAALVDVLGRLRDASACARYLQGGILARLREAERWQRLRPDLLFAEFCVQEIGLSYRTVRDLMYCYEEAARVGLTPERMREIGWTKAREILRVARPETLATWLATAKDLPRSQLVEKVRTERAIESGTAVPRDPRRPWTVQITADEEELIQRAVEDAATADQARVMRPGEALSLICLDWLANRLPRERSINWLLAQIRRVYRVRVAIIAGPEPIPRGAESASD